MALSPGCAVRRMVAAACLWSCACGGNQPVGSAIVFTTIPPAGEGGPQRTVAVAGHVRGLVRGQRVVLYAKSGIWWVQPVVEKPFTEVKGDSTWSASTHLGTDYAALLVTPEYHPPATLEALPPVGGSVVAVATAKGTGVYSPPARRTLSYSGYEWEIRQIPSERGGINEYDARNAWVDADGCLHLTIAQRDGRWTSAEIALTRSLGYGTYVFVVRDASTLDPAATLDLITWDDTAEEQSHRELDIEISRWGDRQNKDAQYVVQPHFVAANVFRFHAPPGTLTHSLRWQPGSAAFKTEVKRASGSAARIVAEREFTSGIPAAGAETVRLVLYYFRGSPTPPLGTVEVVIEKFQFLP